MKNNIKQMNIITIVLMVVIMAVGVYLNNSLIGILIPALLWFVLRPFIYKYWFEDIDMLNWFVEKANERNQILIEFSEHLEKANDSLTKLYNEGKLDEERYKQLYDQNKRLIERQKELIKRNNEIIK